jgi:hypothetical protein
MPITRVQSQILTTAKIIKRRQWLTRPDFNKSMAPHWILPYLCEHRLSIAAQMFIVEAKKRGSIKGHLSTIYHKRGHHLLAAKKPFTLPTTSSSPLQTFPHSFILHCKAPLVNPLKRLLKTKQNPPKDKTKKTSPS